MSAAKRPKKPATKAGRNAGKSDGRFAKGHDARRNLTKPGSGRPPDEFKQRMRDLASAPAVEKELERVMKSAKNKDWMGAVKYATERGYGKPVQPVELGATESLASLLAAAFKK